MEILAQDLAKLTEAERWELFLALYAERELPEWIRAGEPPRLKIVNGAVKLMPMVGDYVEMDGPIGGTVTKIFEPNGLLEQWFVEARVDCPVGYKTFTCTLDEIASIRY